MRTRSIFIISSTITYADHKDKEVDWNHVGEMAIKHVTEQVNGVLICLHESHNVS